LASKPQISHQFCPLSEGYMFPGEGNTGHLRKALPERTIPNRASLASPSRKGCRLQPQPGPVNNRVHHRHTVDPLVRAVAPRAQQGLQPHHVHRVRARMAATSDGRARFFDLKNDLSPAGKGRARTASQPVSVRLQKGLREGLVSSSWIYSACQMQLIERKGHVMPWRRLSIWESLQSLNVLKLLCRDPLTSISNLLQRSARKD
jgi:hypothetical protein